MSFVGNRIGKGGMFLGVKIVAPSSTLNNTLSLYLGMQEESGTRLDSINSNDGTAFNSPSYRAGVVGNALDLNGSSQYLSVADASEISLDGTSFTIATAVYFDTLGAQHLVSKWGASAAYRDYLMDMNGTYFRFALINSSSDVKLINYSHLSPATSNWYMILAEYDLSTELMGIQVNNGTLQTQALGGDGSITDSSQALSIGASQGSSNYHDGANNFLAIWKRLLTTDEKAELYGSGTWKMHPYA